MELPPHKQRRVENLDVRDYIIKELSQQYGLAEDIIHKIIDSQEAAIAITMENGLLRDIRLPYLGAFKVNQVALSRIYDHNTGNVERTKTLYKDFVPYSGHWMERFLIENSTKKPKRYKTNPNHNLDTTNDELI